MKKIINIVIIILMGIIALGMSIDAHEAEVLSAKEAVFAANSRLYAEWALDEAPRRRARAMAYIYNGEENAPEIAEAWSLRYQLPVVREKYHAGEISYEEYLAQEKALSWNIGRCLVAWSERTGRYPADWGEGWGYCYFACHEDGSDREERIYYSNGKEVNEHYNKVCNLFNI